MPRSFENHCRVERRTAAHVEHGDIASFAFQFFGGLFGGSNHLADGEDAHAPVALADAPGEQAVAYFVLADLMGCTACVANGDRSIVGERDGVVQHHAKLLRARRCEHTHAGNLRE